MQKLIAIFIVCTQCLLTVASLTTIYMLYALSESDFGIDGLFGLFFLQPIFGVSISLLTVFVCVLAGLPIRLNKRLNAWWINHFYLAIAGIVIGAALLILAQTPYFKETLVAMDSDETVTQPIPNPHLAYSGWFLMAFSFLHFYPPRRVIQWLNAIVNKF